MKPKLLLLLILIVAATYFYYLHNEEKTVKEGQAAPSFSLPSQSGSVSLEDFRGKTVLLNFWASWCPPCVCEMPSLEMFKKYMEGKNFQVLAVSVDEGGWRDIEAFLKNTPVTLKILSDAKGDVASQYGTYQLPETYLIDPKGKVIKKYVGPEAWMSPAIIQEIEGYVQH